MSILFSACLAFLKIGAFSFGGGYAVLTFIEREIVSGNAWISAQDFVNIVAIAEMTPGPIAVNASTFVGYRLGGVLGGILCTASALLVPFLVTLLVAIFTQKLGQNGTLKRALLGIRPAVIGLVASACFSIAKISFADWAGFGFFALALLLVWKCKVSPILTIIICGALGAAFYGFVLPLVSAL